MQEPLQVAEQEVDVERALVGFVEDERRVGAQERVGLDLRQQNAVRHELDAGVAPGVVVEAHFAADLAAPGDAQFLGDAAGNAHRRHTARLGAADASAKIESRFQAHFWELCRFARAGLPRYDQDAMGAQSRNDLFAPGANREVGRVVDGECRLQGRTLYPLKLQPARGWPRRTGSLTGSALLPDDPWR